MQLLVKVVAFLFLTVMIYLFLKFNIMENIYISDKIEIGYDSREKEFTVSLYDLYGHYIDSTKLDRDDMKALYESLDKEKMFFNLEF
jgi:hypothetical protein